MNDDNPGPDHFKLILAEKGRGTMAYGHLALLYDCADENLGRSRIVLRKLEIGSIEYEIVLENLRDWHCIRNCLAKALDIDDPDETGLGDVSIDRNRERKRLDDPDEWW